MVRRFGELSVLLVVAYACSSSSSTPSPDTNHGGTAGAGRGGGTAGAGRGGSATAGAGRGDAGQTDGGERGEGGRDAVSGAGGGETAGSGNAGRSTGAGGEGAETGAAGTNEGGLAGAGGEGPIAPVDFAEGESGSRLKARMLVGEDGSRHFAGFRDTLLDLLCDFEDVGGGDYRCVPSANEPYAWASSDDQCSAPALGMRAGCGAVPSYASRALGPRPNCDGVPIRDVVAVGATLPSAYAEQGYGCAVLSDTDPIEWHATSPASAETFVGASLEATDLGDGLRILRFHATDGARQTFSLSFDGSRCRPVEITGAGTRCASATGVLFTQFYSDDSCATRVGNVFEVGRDCELPPNAVTRTADPNDSCRAIVGVTAILPLTATSGFRDNAGDCQAVTFPPVMVTTRVQVGASVDATRLPELSLLRPGTTRLRAERYLTPNESTYSVAPHAIYDETLGIPCTPARFADGTLRCFSSSPDVVDPYYGDANCTVRVSEQRACVVGPYAVDWHTDPTCADRSVIRAVYRPRAPHTGAVYQLVDQSCELVTTSLEQTFAEIEPVAPETFVALTEEFE